MGWGMEYLAGQVIGRGIDVANAAMDVGSNIPGVRDQVAKLRSSIHEVEKYLTPEHRYQGTNGGDIYAWFHEGPDPQSKDLQHAVKGWNKVSEHHKEGGDALNSAMSKIRANWQGQAGEGAANSTEPLRQSADTAHEHSKQAATTLQAQADGFHDTKNRVVKMDSQPPVASIKEMVTGNNRLDARVGEYTATQQANQQAFSGYGNTTGTNIQDVPNFQPAPEKPAQPGQDAQPVPGVGGQSSDFGSTASPSSTTASGVDCAGGSGAHPSQPSSGQAPSSRPDSPATSQPAFHFQRPGKDERQDQQPHHSGTGAGMAAGAAGAAVGGGAIAGGSLLGSNAGGIGSGSGGRGLGQEAGGRSGGGSSGSGGRGALGPGGQSGSGGPASGAVTGGGAGGTRGAAGMGAAPPAAGGRGDDQERERPDYLTEANPHEVFGLDERVAPPVFGDQNPPNDDD